MLMTPLKLGVSRTTAPQVTMSELQTFVGYLGGVQKFFEQRRKRVTQSRKDAGAPGAVSVAAA